jgi:hypothetical protein
MSNFRVLPIPNSIAQRVRETRLDDFGHNLSVSVGTENDSGPCRSCLKVFVPGEGRLLFSYAPNQCDHPYNEIGPVYIHEEECQPYADSGSFPPEIRTRRPMTLRCYTADGTMIGAELVGTDPAGGRAIEEVIESLFENHEVNCLHARTASVGCYIARVERV